MYSHVCDGEKDCRDGSDEEGCASRCKAGLFCAVSSEKSKYRIMVEKLAKSNA